MVKKIKLAVIGSPISHSRSPEIHQDFANQAGINIEFNKVELSKSNLDDWVHSFFLDGGKGLSITLPFKEDCLSLADEISDRAEITKAINVLFNNKGKILGDCTDGVGLVKDLTVNKNQSIKEKSILVIGAGGASRGILPSLLKEQPKSIVIANRTVEKAERIVKEFSSKALQTSKSSNLIASSLSLEAMKDFEFDIVINATSVSTNPSQNLNLDESVFRNTSLALDLYYSQAFTPFMDFADRAKVPLVIDGWGMLVEQAAESFFLWTGFKPDTLELIAKHGE